MNIFSYIRDQRQAYENDTIPLFDGYDYSQYDTLNQENHYWVDSYVDDNAYDDVIGNYPFDNISKYRVLLEARATDFDTKHVEVDPIDGSKEAVVSAMVATKALNMHLHDIKFGEFMNKCATTRAKHGGVIASADGDKIVVDDWQNMITDQSDIMAGVRIKRYYMTPSEIKVMEGTWDNVDDAIKAAQDFKDKDVANTSDNQAKTQGDTIEVFVIMGDMKTSYLKEAQAIKDDKEYNTEDDEDYKYTNVRIIVCGADWEDEDSEEENGIILYAEEETKPLQWYIARNAITGRGKGESVIESLFEHQKWHNFTKTEELRMVAVAGKKLYWTDDPDILANIFDEGVDHGTVLRVSQGKTLQELNQYPTGTPVYQNIRAELDASADKITSSFGAVIGEEAKSGTPFRAQKLQDLRGGEQFDQYREEMGFFYQAIIEEKCLPDALKKAASNENIYTTFNPKELQLIDEVIVEDAVLEQLVEMTMKGQVVAPEMVVLLRDATRKKLHKGGNKRTLKGVKEFIKNAGDKVTIHTTDETRNKATLYESYSGLLGLLSPEDPRFNAVVDKVLNALGLPEEELKLYADQAAHQQKAQVGAPQSPVQGGKQLADSVETRQTV